MNATGNKVAACQAMTGKSVRLFARPEQFQWQKKKWHFHKWRKQNKMSTM